MNLKIKAAVVSVAGVLALTACSASGGVDSANNLSVVGFSVLESANLPVFEDFKATDAGKDVDFTTSYGSSGDQSRAVEGGLDADYVHFSLETDVTRLVDAGLVAADWKNTPTDGIVTSSVVVFVVREGNPKNIQSWDDLVKPGVEIITPNPGSSGSARWNILAAWAHAANAKGGSEDKAREFVKQFLGNTIALPSSAREATTAFADGNGDVLISYENEAILARQNGEPFDYVVPADTLLIENPGAVLTDAAPKAQDFFTFLISPEAQAEYAAFGFRPVVDGVDVEVEGANDPANPFPAPATLFTIDGDFGGWAEAAPTFFDEETGIIPQLQAETGTEGEE